MTDRAESEVRKWALRKNGESLTLRDVVELVFAQADDADARHKENVDIAKAMNERLITLEREHEERGRLCPFVVAGEVEVPITQKELDSWWSRHVSSSLSRFLWLLLGAAIVAFTTWLVNR